MKTFKEGNVYKMKKSNGITLIALVIIIVIIGVVIVIGLKYAKEYTENQKIEDVKSTMLSIQGVITHINNKHTVDEANNALEGIKLELDNNTTGYNITDELKNSLLSIEGANLYILTKEELNNHGIKDVNINNTEFYVVDYSSGEIFYSLGLNGKYKLSEM